MTGAEPFATLLRDYCGAAGYSPRQLAAATAARWPRGAIPYKTLDHWWHGRVATVQDATDLLKIAALLGLNAARTGRLLRAAGKPALITLLARPADPGAEDLLAPWRRAAPHNLPAPLDGLFGREDLALAIAERLSSPAIRLVTLTGPGGVGKTRLALAVAERLLDAFPDGVSFAALETLGAADPIAPSIAGALGLRLADGLDDVAQLAAHCAGRVVLLLLDNAEQLPAFAALLQTLLAHAPTVHALVTSRVPLGLRGETVWRVPPLPVPHARDTPATHPTLALFLARARERDPGFAPTPADHAAMCELCARVDGLPLAIELLAAQLAWQDPAALLETFVSPLALRQDRRGDIPARQRSLGDTLDWSYGLLTPTQQACCRALAVCVGGWTADGARRLCGHDDPRATGEALAALVAANLIERARATGTASRYRFLVVVREYARARLAANGDEHAAAGRLCDWCIALAEADGIPLDGSDPAPAFDDRVSALRRSWLDRLDAERPNLAAALAWAREHDPGRGLRLAGALGLYWYARHDQEAGRGWLRTLLAAAPREAAGRDVALFHLGLLELWRDVAASRAAFAAALALAEKAGNGALAMAIRPPLAYVLMRAGAYAEAAAALAVDTDVVERDAIPRLRGIHRSMRGYLADDLGRAAEAEALLAAALADVTAAAQWVHRCGALARLAHMAVERGAEARARTHLAQLEATAARFDLTLYRLAARNAEGLLHEWRGDRHAAAAAYATGLALARAAGFGGVPRAQLLLGCARVALDDRALDDAHAALDECLALLGDVENAILRRDLAPTLGETLWRRGARDEARPYLARALAWWPAGGFRAGRAAALEAMADLCADDGAAGLAARLLGAAAATRAAAGVAVPPGRRQAIGALDARLQEALARPHLDAAFAQGQARGAAIVADEARRWLFAAAPAPAAGDA